MITKLVTIYDRGADGVYLHGSAFTDMGVLIAIPPFVHLPSSTVHEGIWAEVLSLLEKSGGTVPHPTKFDQLDPLYEIARCRDWRSFVRNSRCCSAEATDDELAVTPMIRDGKGFSALKDEKIKLRRNPTPDEGRSAVYAALGDRLTAPSD